MVCIICFDLSEIIKPLKSTKRPVTMQVIRILRDQQEVIYSVGCGF